MSHEYRLFVDSTSLPEEVSKLVDYADVASSAARGRGMADTRGTLRSLAVRKTTPDIS
jgi:hypothetical protein